MSETRPDRTLGGHHDQFWDWCGKGELRLQRCGGCGKLAWPAVAACEFCGSAELAWVPMSGRGRVISWCSFEHDYYKGMLALPHETILVELDEGAMLVSNPLGFSGEDAAPDMAVEVRFIDCEDSGGAFKLPVFARA